MTSVTRIWLAAALLATAGPILAQSDPRDSIDRGLQERAVQERSLSLKLDEARPLPRPLSPQDVKRSVTLPTPGTEVLQRQAPPSLAPLPRVAAPGPAVPTPQQLLDDSQRRRQADLQTRLPRAPVTGNATEDVVRQQSLQLQQLEFQREQSAQRLGSEIMRNSERAMRR